MPNNEEFLKSGEYFHTKIVGIYYTNNGDYISSLKEGTNLELKAEPDNRYDSYAVSVWHEGRKLGYIPKTENRPVFNTISLNKTATFCILGQYKPSSSRYSSRRHSTYRDFTPERAYITIHTFNDESIQWRPVDLLPEDRLNL
jgi:hypothetical protein